MLLSEIKTIKYDNDEIQRIQTVKADSFEELNFFTPSPSEEAFGRVCNLYRNYIIPRAPYIFSRLAIFRLPDGFDMNLPTDFKKYGTVADTLCAAAAVLRLGVKLNRKGEPSFKTEIAEKLWRELENSGCVQTCCGLLPDTVILPVSNRLGMMTASETSAKLKVNSSFFIMDRFDCGSVYDSIGTPVGLNIKNGEILNPPLYKREALLSYEDGHTEIKIPELNELQIVIGEKTYKAGENCEIFTRPKLLVTSLSKCRDLVIIGKTVAAVKQNGKTVVPCSGFVLRIYDDLSVLPGDSVSYKGMDKVSFALQVGNSCIAEGVPTKNFISKFYNIKTFGVVFPPSLYPLDYEKARAPRIAIGATEDGKPVIVWAEGAGKLKYTPGQDSCGASLNEMAEICKGLGLYNAVNLDGGGSAQILINNKRQLQVSDRYPDNSESERAVPSGLIIR